MGTDVAWGSVLPLLGAYTTKLTGDIRLGQRVAIGASKYVQLLHSFANNASSGYPGLLNATSVDGVGWAGSGLGDWVPAAGGGIQVSALLNSHHLILDTDATADVLELTAPENLSSLPSASELRHWSDIARQSFVKAFLRNVTVPGTTPPPVATCGSVSEKQKLVLRCGPGENITRVTFAAYGLPPQGDCEKGFQPNKKCSLDVRAPVASMCEGRSACEVECLPIPHQRICANVSVNDPCPGVEKGLSVSVTCSNATDPSPSTSTGLSGREAVVGLAFRDIGPVKPSSKKHYSRPQVRDISLNRTPNSTLHQSQPYTKVKAHYEPNCPS